MVSHFYNVPFYVYAYAFGQLLVLALYKQYREEGDSFKPRYLEILSTGGSDSPVRTLGRAGIDVASPDFWNGGFQVVEEALQKLEAMPVEASSSNGKSDTEAQRHCRFSIHSVPAQLDFIFSEFETGETVGRQ